jgi:beta-glucosidase
MKFQLVLVGLFAVVLTLPLFGQPSVSDTTIEKLVGKMTIEEKLDFIGGYQEFHIRAVPRLGIPQINMADGPVGVRNYGRSTAYPAGINLAASWDKKMAYEVGKAIACEARSKNAHIILGPALNIYRMPLCGRNFEYLGEDPYLAGHIAKEYITGMQDQGIIACVKHYAANNQEFNRHTCSSDMDERTLHEIYLPAFKTAVQEGKVGAVMTSYNLINGIHASENNYLINQVLKGDWGFGGFVMSDWVSTYNGLNCARGGLDIEMPSGRMMNRETLLPVIQNGTLHEEVINDKIRRILRVYKRFGLFEHPDVSKGYLLNSNYVRQTALNAARGGMVLLKNEKNILPIKRDKIKTIAILGPHGKPAVTGGGGSSYINPIRTLSLADAVKQVAGDGIAVAYEKGLFTGAPFPEGLFDHFDFYVYNNGKRMQGVNADFYNGKKLEGDIIASKFFKKLDLTDDELWNGLKVQVDFSARFSCFYSPQESGYYSIGGSGDDGYRIKLDGKTILELWRDQDPTRSKYDVFLDAGKEYKIEVEYYQSGGGAQIKLGVAKAKVEMKPEEYTALALEAAKKADLVILTVGFDNITESEGFDRTFEMPYKQSEFIKTIAQVNSNIVVVLNAGGNVEMSSWIDDVKGLLMAWYPGQEGNLAAAEIFFGITNPSGKLPASFEYRLEENPCDNYYFDKENTLKVFYGEGIFMGYRYWDTSKSKPRFPFGFGLSYTTFACSDISTDKKEYSSGEPVRVQVAVQNTGVLEGAEVVQLYVSDKVSTFPRPVKELKGFEKIQLAPGEKKVVEFELHNDAFAFYNPTSHSWEVEPGDFEICIGNSSANISQTASINIK